MKRKSNRAACLVGTLFLFAMAALCVIAIGYGVRHREREVPATPPTHTSAPPGYSLQTDGQGHYALRFDYAGGLVLHSYFGEWMTREQCLTIAWEGYDSLQSAERQYRERNRQQAAHWEDVGK